MLKTSMLTLVSGMLRCSPSASRCVYNRHTTGQQCARAPTHTSVKNPHCGTKACATLQGKQHPQVCVCTSNPIVSKKATEPSSDTTFSNITGLLSRIRLNFSSWGARATLPTILSSVWKHVVTLATSLGCACLMPTKVARSFSATGIQNRGGCVDAQSINKRG